MSYQITTPTAELAKMLDAKSKEIAIIHGDTYTSASEALRIELKYHQNQRSFLAWLNTPFSPDDLETVFEGWEQECTGVYNASCAGELYNYGIRMDESKFCCAYYPDEETAIEISSPPPPTRAAFLECCNMAQIPIFISNDLAKELGLIQYKDTRYQITAITVDSFELSAANVDTSTEIAIAQGSKSLTVQVTSKGKGFVAQVTLTYEVTGPRLATFITHVKSISVSTVRGILWSMMHVVLPLVDVDEIKHTVVRKP